MENFSEKNGLTDAKMTKIIIGIFLTSFLILFQELVLIRWVPVQVRVAAYFPNCILLSAFLGLGLGSLLGKTKSILPLWPIALLIFQLAAYLASSIVFTANTEGEHLWLLYYDAPKDCLIIKSVLLPVLVIFILSTLTFVSLGQLLGMYLRAFSQRNKKLTGYTLDLCGSLCGILVFTMFSVSTFRPIWWFGILAVPGTVLLLMNLSLKKSLSSLVALIAIITISYLADSTTVYSPYYAIDINPMSEGGYELATNRSLHQVAAPIRNSNIHTSKYFQNIQKGYHLPYELLNRKIGRVLILGAGNGNDVATLLDLGAERIDAVEIDPIILEAGKRHHPDKPYSSDKVHTFVTDARNFLRNSTEKYDLIIFATLDSMTKLSALSNVRLDNFVYTEESIKEAKNHLIEGGGVLLFFMVGKQSINDKILRMMSATFGDDAYLINYPAELFNIVYLGGSAFKDYTSRDERVRSIKSLLPPVQNLGYNNPIPTDDWPHLYLDYPSLSSFYIWLIVMVLATSIISVALVSKSMRVSLLSGRNIDWEMIFLGAGFLLLETRAVTQMSLLWGVTWQTSAVVFACVLVTLIFGTIFTSIKRVSPNVSLPLLLASLVILYFVPPSLLLTTNFTLKLFTSFSYLALPIFFASLLFASQYAERESVELAFGWNLLGAVIGGLLEFLAMVLGYRALLLIVALLYLLSFLSRSISVRLHKRANQH